MKIEIEKGIPMAGHSTRAARFMDMPFDKLKVGESFIFPGSSRTSAYNACYYASTRFVKKFSTRAVLSESGEKQFRIWRVS